MIWYSLTEDQRITKTKMLKKNHWSPHGKWFSQNVVSPTPRTKTFIHTKEWFFTQPERGRALCYHSAYCQQTRKDGDIT